MRRLDGLSAFLLAAEKPGAFQHTLKIGIYDPTDAEGAWTYQRFRDDLDRHLSLAPALRWKLQRVPFNLHRPLWATIPASTSTITCAMSSALHPGTVAHCAR